MSQTILIKRIIALKYNQEATLKAHKMAKIFQTLRIVTKIEEVAFKGELITRVKLSKLPTQEIILKWKTYNCSSPQQIANLSLEPVVALLMHQQ